MLRCCFGCLFPETNRLSRKRCSSEELDGCFLHAVSLPTRSRIRQGSWCVDAATYSTAACTDIQCVLWLSLNWFMCTLMCLTAHLWGFRAITAAVETIVHDHGVCKLPQLHSFWVLDTQGTMKDAYSYTGLKATECLAFVVQGMPWSIVTPLLRSGFAWQVRHDILSHLCI